MHEPVVEARLYGVRKKFGNFTAVDGIDLEVQRGEFFSLLGLSGCGKTTSLRSLGAGPWTAFRTVTLPLIYPGILAGALLAFASTTTSPPASTPVRP